MSEAEEEARAAEFRRQATARARWSERNERYNLRGSPTALRAFRLKWQPILDALHDRVTGQRTPP